MKRLLLFTAMTVFILACSDKEAKKEKDMLMEQVMAAHDEVMPKMGELRRLSKDLKAKADSLTALNDPALAGEIQQLTFAAEKIESANESMMVWMRQFEQPDNEAPLSEVIAYLKDQKEKIDKVKEAMLKSLEEGKSLR